MSKTEVQRLVAKFGLLPVPKPKTKPGTNQRRIVEFARQCRYFTVEDASKSLKVEFLKAQRAINHLVRKNALKRIREAADGKYGQHRIPAMYCYER